VENFISRQDVESILYADIPEPTMPEIQVAELKRAPRTSAV
jgi:hypothetical protein